MEGFIPYCLPTLDDSEIDEVVDTLRSGWLTTGPKVARFEEAFRQYAGSAHALAVNSCTGGLHLSLAALRIGAGDEVITTTLTFCATANVAVHLGATPVLADITLDDYNIDPADVERRITPRTKAIMPVHYAGQPCRMDEIMDIAERHNLAVIEDAAHAVGAEYKGRRIGDIGHATSFSFYATKNMTTGEGGMVTTNDDELAERVRLLTLHGMSHDAWDRYSDKGSWYYEVLAPGYKYNMMDLQAALGLHQMEKLESFIEERQKQASLYQRYLGDVEEIILPVSRPDVRHVWHLYAIRVVADRLTIGRGEFIEELRERGIGTSVHFIPIHCHPWYREQYGYKQGDFPNAEAVYEGLISLPLYPRLGEEGVARVSQAVRDVVSKHRR